MTNTKELIELAAKACGVEHVTMPMVEWGKWNPATNSGDGAEMEAELGIDVYWCLEVVNSVYAGGLSVETMERYSDHNGDRQAARRMASLRCAAAIQKAREGK